MPSKEEYLYIYMQLSFFTYGVSHNQLPPVTSSELVTALSTLVTTGLFGGFHLTVSLIPYQMVHASFCLDFT